MIHNPLAFTLSTRPNGTVLLERAADSIQRFFSSMDEYRDWFRKGTHYLFPRPPRRKKDKR